MLDDGDLGFEILYGFIWSNAIVRTHVDVNSLKQGKKRSPPDWGGLVGLLGLMGIANPRLVYQRIINLLEQWFLVGNFPK